MAELRTTLTVGERSISPAPLAKKSARQSVQSSIGVSPVCPRAPASISRASGRWILIRDGILLANRSLRQTKRSPLCPGLGNIAVGAKNRTQAGRLCYHRLGLMPATWARRVSYILGMSKLQPEVWTNSRNRTRTRTRSMDKHEDDYVLLYQMFQTREQSGTLCLLRRPADTCSPNALA